MLSTIWNAIKVSALWVYHWVTVLTAIILGGLTVFSDYIEQMAGLDFTAIVDARRAAQITFGVAITKAVVAAYNAKKSA